MKQGCEERFTSIIDIGLAMQKKSLHKVTSSHTAEKVVAQGPFTSSHTADDM